MAGRIFAAPLGWSTSRTDADPVRSGVAIRPACWLSWLVLGASLAACAGEPPPPEPPVPAAPLVARAVPRPAEPRIPQAAFCSALTGLIEAGSDGFAALRGELLGSERWAGLRTLPGTERCVIEGEAWPRARYECAGPPVPADRHDRAASQFALLGEQIDDCLARPSWHPRTWQRNQPLEFAMGERQQTWTDLSTLPPSAVVLKLQRGLSGDDYRVLLDVGTIR
jgi:hypothetical protein